LINSGDSDLQFRFQYFVFEILHDTEQLFKSFDPRPQEILGVFVGGTLDQLDSLVAAGLNTSIAEAKLPLDRLRFPNKDFDVRDDGRPSDDDHFGDSMTSLKLDAAGLK
jgi:hypothetical protein